MLLMKDPEVPFIQLENMKQTKKKILQSEGLDKQKSESFYCSAVIDASNV